ncbi:chemotaxis protein CheB [Daejeonella sp.]|uniref:chemotaxis protein CheB n=1 Tax=Daejeonella sp. TaxID=2805397 RepID=UPI002731A258|nr:chemotaxis protein CheB [Daejeonella sp.]MDP2415303.1 chemotaxis protein CheB [Daejeonella sp.]
MIGCSAGGFSLLHDLILQLPENYPVAVIVIIHRSRKYESRIEKILTAKGLIPVKLAADKQWMKPGNVYFAPADYHLLLEPDRSFTLDFSEPVHFCRPSIDVTFQSVSDVLGSKVIGVLLSGANRDGANGIKYIGDKGGLTVVQDPQEAEVNTMPQSAIALTQVDLILKNEELFNLFDEIYRIKVTSANVNNL